MGFRDELTEIYDLELKVLEPMKKHTAIGCGGAADYFTEIRSLYSLNSALELSRRYRVPVKIIGCGSNVLVSDKGFKGLIISTKRLSDVFLKKDGVMAMCGASIKSLAEFAAKNKLSGVEGLVGIPGTVGGAVIQNAGAFGHSVSDYVVTVETLRRGKLFRYDADECGFGYRKSRFKCGRETIVSATFALKKADETQIRAAMKEFSERRKNTQPQGKNCGSVFMNPKGFSAGKLIEDAGLKGLSVGGASVSLKHANFISAASYATASDVRALIEYIKKKVYDKFGVKLKEEVEYIGEF